MKDNDCKEIMDDILELDESVVVIIGWCDIVNSEIGYSFKNLKQDSDFFN